MTNYTDVDTLRIIDILDVREQWGRLLDLTAFAAHYDITEAQARDLLNHCFDPTACYHELER